MYPQNIFSNISLFNQIKSGMANMKLTFKNIFRFVLEKLVISETINIIYIKGKTEIYYSVIPTAIC